MAPASNVATIDVDILKTELLLALRGDISAIFKAELQTALGGGLPSIKSKLLFLKSELTSSISAVQQSVTRLTHTVGDMERSFD